MKHYLLSTLVTMLLLLSACGGGGKPSSTALSGEAIALKHASLLTIVEKEGYTQVTVRNPWDTVSALHTYLLVPKGEELPPHLPNGTIVRTPLNRSVVYSAVHGSLLEQLGKLSAIAGVCDLRYFRMPEIQEGCANGKVADLGNSLSPDTERMIELHPDALFISPFKNSGGYGWVEKLNIPIIECADYMENSPLGRAEWMRFYGKLFGCEAEADSLFATVEKAYLSLCKQAASVTDKPLVLADVKTGSTWYQAGEKSTMGQLYAHAGGNYPWDAEGKSGSLPLSAEKVMEQGLEADVWIIKYNRPTELTYRDLKADYAPYATFKAFRERNIYGCNSHIIPFYEESPFHPEYLLEDLIRIFHPGLLPEGNLRYFKKLAE